LQQAAFIMLNMDMKDRAIDYLERAFNEIMKEPNEQMKIQELTDLGVFVYRSINTYSLGTRAEALLAKIEPYLQAAESPQDSGSSIPLP
ncbi:MAG TPA: hypothetical protein PKK33_07615, partial [Candidatus Cloacimonadota bacterium]|nr:hypothetical protein [Candidatus Cloacimonadota bacterium]